MRKQQRISRICSSAGSKAYVPQARKACHHTTLRHICTSHPQSEPVGCKMGEGQLALAGKQLRRASLWHATRCKHLARWDILDFRWSCDTMSWNVIPWVWTWCSFPFRFAQDSWGEAHLLGRVRQKVKPTLDPPGRCICPVPSHHGIIKLFMACKYTFWHQPASASVLLNPNPGILGWSSRSAVYALNIFDAGIRITDSINRTSIHHSS